MPDREKVISKLEKEVQRTYSTKTTVFQNGEKVSEEINTHREPCVRIPIEIADKILVLLKEQDADIQDLRRENHNILTQFHEWAKEQEAVVRCKDCKWNNGYTGCDKYLLPHGGDWFCADGERRTE